MAPDRQTFDIAVAGCGPAGLAAGLLLARAGHRVVLFDRMDKPAPIGSGLMLQPTGLAVLAALGLGDRIIGLGQRIDRLFGRAAPSGRIVLDVRYGALAGGRFGLAVHRAALFAALFDAVAEAGIPIETRCELTEFESVAGGQIRLVDTSGRRPGPFDLIVDAMGVNSPLAPRQGRTLDYGALWASLDWPAGGPFDPHTLEQRYRRASTMVGVLPMGRIPGDPATKTAFFWSLKSGGYDAWRRRGLDAWRDEVMALWPETAPLLGQIDHPDRLVMARYTHHTLARPWSPGIAHIGDSAHSASPQLGQGANMALLDALALALALDRTGDIAGALPLYAGLRRRHVRLYQAMSFAFTPFYQSDSHLLPVLRDWLVGPLSKIWPAPQILAATVAGLIGDPLRPLALAEADLDPSRVIDAPSAGATTAE